MGCVVPAWGRSGDILGTLTTLYYIIYFNKIDINSKESGTETGQIQTSPLARDHYNFRYYVEGGYYICVYDSTEIVPPSFM